MSTTEPVLVHAPSQPHRASFIETLMRASSGAIVGLVGQTIVSIPNTNHLLHTVILPLHILHQRDITYSQGPQHNHSLTTSPCQATNPVNSHLVLAPMTLLTAGDGSLSDAELLGNVKAFFLAGSDTTSVVKTTHPMITSSQYILFTYLPNMLHTLSLHITPS